MFTENGSESVVAYDPRFKAEGFNCSVCYFSTSPNFHDCAYHHNKKKFSEESVPSESKPEECAPEETPRSNEQRKSTLASFISLMIPGQKIPEDVAKSIDRISSEGEKSQKDAVHKLMEMLFSSNKEEYWNNEIKGTIEKMEPILSSAAKVSRTFNLRAPVVFHLESAASHLKEALKFLSTPEKK